jgi:hypothetical protein
MPAVKNKFDRKLVAAENRNRKLIGIVFLEHPSFLADGLTYIAYIIFLFLRISSLARRL